MKILIYRWSVFHQEDIAEAFESFGHTVEYYEEMPDERKGTDIRRLKEVRPCFFCQLFFTGV